MPLLPNDEILVIDAPDRALIRVGGVDAQDFLHRMATAAIKTLPKAATEGEAVELRPTLFLKGDGRLVANCWIARLAAGDEYLISTEAASRQELLNHLDRFLIMEKVVIEDLTANYRCANLLLGSHAQTLAAAGALAYYMQLADGHALNLISFPHTLWRCEMWIPPETSPANFQNQMAERYGRAVKIGSAEDYTRLRIQAGEPAWGAELGLSTIPLEAGLLHAIDFNKGCFPGQEIVARINNLGHPANVLVGLRAQGEIKAGDALFSQEKSVGKITSIARIADSWIALAYVKWDYREPDAVLALGTAGGAAATVSAFPLNPS